MKTAPRRGSRSRLIRGHKDPQPCEEVPETPIELPPEMDSGEFDRRIVEEFGRLNGLTGRRP